MNKTIHISLASGLCLLLLSSLTNCFAAQTGDQVSYDFKGTFVLSTPCTVNDDEVINVNFGNVGVTHVDGIAFSQPIPYTVNCHGAVDNSPLKLTISGTAENFDEAAVTTSAEGLGIQIQANGIPLKLNQPLSTTLGAISSLKLTAVPVKDPLKELTEQPFTATATLTADYQ